MDKERLVEEVEAAVEEHIIPALRQVVESLGVENVKAKLAFSESVGDRDLDSDEEGLIRKSLWTAIESRVIQIANEE